MTVAVRPNTSTYLTTALCTESQEILRIGLRMTTRACLAVTPRECPSVVAEGRSPSSQAATLAGYSPRTAYSQGSQLLTFVEVQQAIETER